MRHKLSVLIPCFKEDRTIHHVVEKVAAAALENGVDLEIIVIDDGSGEPTVSLLKDLQRRFPQTKVIFKDRNEGKGAALRTGIASATGDIVLVQDADLEYDPANYKEILRPILNGKADVVIGSRFRGLETRVLYFWHMVGNKFLTLLSNMFSNLNLTDMECGYKAFRLETLNKINLKSNRFGFEPEVIAKISKIRGVRIYEVPVDYAGRTYAEGKKITWRDGVAALYFIIKYNLFSGP